MVLLTHSFLRSGFRFLSGILLDPITDADFPRKPFKAFVASDAIREIVCEFPIPPGGFGRASDGQTVLEFESELFGTKSYNVPFGSIGLNLVKHIIENRIELVTTDDMRGVAFPAFLSIKSTSPPAISKVSVRMDVKTVRDLPEMQLFASLEPSVMERAESQGAIVPITILPIAFRSQRGLAAGAFEIHRSPVQSDFEGLIYHEADKEKPTKETVLEREISFQNPRIRKKLLERGKAFHFRSTIGVITSVTAG
jgi:hypothetical protein